MSAIDRSTSRDLLLLVVPGAVLTVIAIVVDQGGEPNSGPLWVTLVLFAVAIGLLLTGLVRMAFRRQDTRRR